MDRAKRIDTIDPRGFKDLIYYTDCRIAMQKRSMIG